jgi:hypothetical protein
MSDLELLQNLWQLLNPTVAKGQIDSTQGRLDERTAALKQNLERLKNEPGRPSSSLHAHASLLLIDLIKSIGSPPELRRVLVDFQSVFEKSKGLIDFPAIQFVDILMEIGEHFPDDAGFDDTFESVLLLTRERESRVVSGRMLLRRGIQKLKGKKPYETIRLLGRAQQDLAMHESRAEMAAALALCAGAYEMAGLFWAARGSLSMANCYFAKPHGMQHCYIPFSMLLI